MLPTDKGTRDLLPLIHADAEHRPAVDEPSDGVSLMESALFPHVVAPEAPRTPDAELSEEDDADEGASIAVKAPLSSHAVFQLGSLGGEAAGHANIDAPAFSLDVELSKPLALSGHRGAGSHSDRDGASPGSVQDPGGAQDDDDAVHGFGRSSGADGDAAGPIRVPLQGAGAPGPLGPADEDVHSIALRQDAEVDQDARIIVNGYAGKVVARLHIDQDLLMDQDLEIDITIDGDGHFSVLLDQDMRIDQNIDIDLKIFDVKGVLYVDLFLKDSISVEQDMSLDMHIGDGPPGGSAAIDQSLEMNQDVDIDIDIEDDLEERFLVKVDVDVEQDVEADQDADIDITDRSGDIDMDVDAFQTASIDQETTVRIDFTAV
jgi:hypothetical protein